MAPSLQDVTASRPHGTCAVTSGDTGLAVSTQRTVALLPLPVPTAIPWCPGEGRGDRRDGDTPSATPSWAQASAGPQPPVQLCTRQPPCHSRLETQTGQGQRALHKMTSKSTHLQKHLQVAAQLPHLLPQLVPQPRGAGVGRGVSRPVRGECSEPPEGTGHPDRPRLRGAVGGER